jgi:hypothetical protein
MDGGSLSVMGSSRIVNSTATWGGAVYFSSDAGLDIGGGSELLSSHARNSGGALYIVQGSTVSIVGGYITDSTAVLSGGAVMQTGGDCTIMDSRITGSSAALKGGGLQVCIARKLLATAAFACMHSTSDSLTAWVAVCRSQVAPCTHMPAG